MPSCSRKECFISGFDVTVNRTSNTVTFTAADPCNQLTSCRLLKQVLLAALAEFLADTDNADVVALLTPNTGCDCACGYQELEFVFDTMSFSFDVGGGDTTSADGGDVVIEVTLPLAV